MLKNDNDCNDLATAGTEGLLLASGRPRTNICSCVLRSHEGGDMSTIRIQLPADHIEAFRRSLLGRRGDAECPDEFDDLLTQLATCAPGTGPCEVVGPRRVLWNVVYDSLCAAAEQLAEDCNDYWRGAVAADSARGAVADVSTRLELLISLGAPPAT
jgi:hypothetical protein